MQYWQVFMYRSSRRPFYDPREMFAAAMTTCGSGLTGGLIVLDRLKGTGLTEMVTIPLFAGVYH